MTAAATLDLTPTNAVEEFDPFNPPPPDEADERARLARALNLTDRFALFVATCNRADVRQEIVAEIKAENPALHLVEVTVDRNVPNLLVHLSTLPNVRDADAVFVSGLESFLPNTEEVAHSSFVVNLNGTRDAFPNTLSCPLVLWLADYARNGLMRGAPDFYSIRSASFVFATALPDAPKIENLITSSVYLSAWQLPFHEHEKRVKELNDLLTQLQSLPDAEQDALTILAVSSRLAGLYSAYGHFHDAELMCRHVYLRSKHTLGVTNRDTLISLGNLVSAYGNLGWLEAAEKLVKEGLAHIEEDKTLLQDIVNAYLTEKLAAIYIEQNRLMEAEVLLQKALSMKEQFGGKDYIEISITISNLSKIYCEQQRFTEAIPLLARAMNISRKCLGNLHPNTLSLINNAGAIYYEQGQIKKGEEMMLEALNSRRFALGPDHPDVAKSLCSLAVLCQREGRLQDAQNLYMQAEVIHNKVFGSEHTYTLNMRQKALELSKLIRKRQVLQPLKMGSRKKRGKHKKN